MDAALAKDRLHHDGDNGVVVVRNPAHCLDVVERCADEAAQQRLETGVDLAIAGSREGRHGPAVKTVVHDDGMGNRDTAFVAVQPGYLYGRFVSFGAGIAEKDVVHAGQRGKSIGESFLAGDAVEIRSVDQRARLFGDGFADVGVRVAEAGDGKSAQRVDVLLARIVIQARSASPGKRDG